MCSRLNRGTQTHKNSYWNSRLHCMRPAGNNAYIIPPTERQIQATIERHGDEFLRYIEWEVLVPYLKVEGLLDGFAKSFEPPYTRCREERLLTFFLKILRTRRGPNQYTRFYRCLAEAKCFGHQLLMELFE